MKGWSLAFALAAAVLAASCTSVEPTAPAQDRFGAPVVTTPRDGSLVAGDPCGSLLTEEEFQGLGFENAGRARDFLGVRSCSWTAADGDNLRMYVDPSRDLLTATYRTWRGVLVPIEIAGMPAARTKTDRGQYNNCSVTTGLGPSQALEISWSAVGDPAPGNDACVFAEQAAALVVPKLPLTG